MFFGFSSIDQLLADLRQPLNWTAVVESLKSNPKGGKEADPENS
jgi:hypothetical protein